MRLARIRTALAGEPGVVALVTRARGSAPRDAGAVMVVTGSGAVGTLGGGAVEHRVLGIVRDMLVGRAPERAELEFPLGPAMDQCCGGSMQVALAVADSRFDGTLWPGGPVIRDPAPAPSVHVYGAGHVGQAVVAALAPLDLALTWVDAQVGRMVAAPDGVAMVETPLPEAHVPTASPDAAHLVMTHSHALDLEIVSAVLSGPFGHCGLIGSATKRALFERRLAKRGVPATAIARLACPIGLPGLRDKRPAAIAASVAADLLMRAPARAHAGAAR